MDDETIERVLRWLLEDGRPGHFTLTDATGQDPLGLSDADLDEALREANDRAFVRGERTDHGPMKRWASVKVTGLGLRFMQEWPPVGREHHDGLWRDGHWGQHAQPVLERIRDGAYPHDFLMPLHNGSSADEWRERLAASELLAHGYLSGQPQENHGIANLRLTAEGRRALDPTPRSALDEARMRMRSSPADAVIYAVEVALGDVLRMHGRAHGLVPTEPDVFKALSTINEGLTGKDGPKVYGKPWKKIIDAVLDVRNEYAHAHGERLPQATAGWAIDTVALVLAGLPPGPA